MIWIWSIPDNYPNKRIGEYVEGSGTDRFVFREGKLIHDKVVPPKIIFDCAEKHLINILPNSAQLITVSKRLLKILNDVCLKDIQVFNANVFVGGKRITNYYLINLTHIVEVVNKKESEFTTILGTDAILSFEKIVYKNDNLGQFHLVRNSDYRSHVLVSEYLKNIFEKEKITGVQFN
jgi:hypothetical protein